MRRLLRLSPLALLLLAAPTPAHAIGFGTCIKQGGFEFNPWPYEAHWRLPAPCAPWNVTPMTLPPNFAMFPCGPGGQAGPMPGQMMPKPMMGMPARVPVGPMPAGPVGGEPQRPAAPDRPADPRQGAQPVGYRQPSPYAVPPASYYPAVPWTYYQAPSWYYGR